MGHLYVYVITNLVNGKKYVGQTRQAPPERRWRDHILRSTCRAPRYPLHRAIKKYGRQNFRFKIIGEYDDVDKWNQAEIDYIKKYRSRWFEHGYNIAEGGRNGGVGPRLDESKVEKLRELYATGDYTYRQLARKTRLSHDLVKRAVRGGEAYARIGKQLPRDHQTNRVRRLKHAHKELRALSRRQVSRLRREYKRGSNTVEIARRHGLGKHLVKNAVFGHEGYAHMKCSEPPAEFVSYALRPPDIEEMRRRYASGWYSYTDLARDFGVTINCAIRAIKGIGKYGNVGKPIPQALTHQEKLARRKKNKSGK